MIWYTIFYFVVVGVLRDAGGEREGTCRNGDHPVHLIIMGNFNPNSTLHRSFRFVHFLFFYL